MSLSDWLDYIAKQHSSSIDLGLSRILPLAQHLKLTQFDCSVVVVAGTNGKGSVVATLERIYLTAGYRVMAYTSPQLMCFNERLRSNGNNISDADWEAAFAAIEKARGSRSLSFFEFVTLAALWICQQNIPEVLLLEVGLGGRLDAVNVVSSTVGVVTTVAMDHMDWLGDTREKIGFEKAGIFQSAQMTVCGDPDPPSTVNAQYQLHRDYHCQSSAHHWQWQSAKKTYSNLPLPTLKLENVATALMITELLNLPIDEAVIVTAIQQLNLAGRYERYDQQVPVIVDVAHNPQSCEYLASRFANENVKGKRYAVVAMLADKAITESLIPFISLIDYWWVAELTDTPRAASAASLQSCLAEKGVAAKTAESVKQALQQVLSEAEVDDCVLVFGSFHTVAAAKALLEENVDATAN